MWSSAVGDYLEKFVHQLEEAGIGTARLDALVLLEDVTGKDRTHLLAHPELILQGPTLQTLDDLVQRRAQHEPLAYIRGKTEFYGREFIINSDVLEPRPESETMIEILKGLETSTEGLKIIDVGTGSGALAITAKLELPDAEVFAIDIDPKCLKIAQNNAQKHAVNIKFIKSDLLTNIPATSYQLPATILANLPYVPDDYLINEAATNEPKHAIFGGPDGLDLYRIMFQQLAELGDKPIFVLTESLHFQHAELAAIARAHNFTQTTNQDFIQVFNNS